MRMISVTVTVVSVPVAASVGAPLPRTSANCHGKRPMRTICVTVTGVAVPAAASCAQLSRKSADADDLRDGHVLRGACRRSVRATVTEML